MNTEKLSITKDICAVKEVRFVMESHSPFGKNRTFDTPPREIHGLVYVLSGRANYIFSASDHFEVERGSVFYLAKNQTYAIEVLTHDYTYIFVNFELSDEACYRSEKLKIKNAEEYEKNFRDLLYHFRQKKPSYTPRSLSVLQKLLADLVDDSNEYTPSDTLKKIEPACKYIRERFASPTISVAFLARLCKMSETHFRRLFTSVFHTSPLQYIQLLRLKQARELLATRELPVYKIAEACGFCDVYHFSKTFKKHYGYPPSKA